MTKTRGFWRLVGVHFGRALLYPISITTKSRKTQKDRLPTTRLQMPSS